MPITRLTYYSQNHIDPQTAPPVRMLSSILSASNRNNKPLGLTGALIFDNQWFMQVLEGEREKVWRTFERISEDERHTDMIVAEVVESDSRTFGNWWMGLATRNSSTEHVFASFLNDGKLDPRRMAATEILALMTAVSRLGLSRELASQQAA